MAKWGKGNEKGPPMRITTNDVSLIGVRFFVELMILDGGLAFGDNPWLDCRGAADWRAETKWNAAITA